MAGLDFFEYGYRNYRGTARRSSVITNIENEDFNGSTDDNYGNDDNDDNDCSDDDKFIMTMTKTTTARMTAD